MCCLLHNLLCLCIAHPHKDATDRWHRLIKSSWTPSLQLWSRYSTMWGRGNSSWCVSPQQHWSDRAQSCEVSANTHSRHKYFTLCHCPAPTFSSASSLWMAITEINAYSQAILSVHQRGDYQITQLHNLFYIITTMLFSLCNVDSDRLK